MAASDTEASGPAVLSLILSLGKCLDIAFSRSRTLLLFWSGEVSSGVCRSEVAEAGLGVAEAGLMMEGGDTGPGSLGLLSPG